MESWQKNRTALSAAEIERVFSGGATSPVDIIRYISEQLPVRRFSDTLCAFGGTAERRRDITESLISYCPDETPDSVRRKSANWFAGKTEPGAREDLIRLCFALSLSAERADEFMALCTEGRFHLRDPRELAYLFCLRTGRDYFEARELIAALPNLPDAACADTLPYTRRIAERFSTVETVEQFRAFIADGLTELGALHNTAYSYFVKYYRMLSEPAESAAAAMPHDAALSIEDTVERYIRMGIPAGKRRGHLSEAQKAVRGFWPNETSVKNMLARREDVTRKSLMILYVATEGGVDAYAPDDPWLLDDEELSPAERFENRIRALELVLSECGMSRADPRNPFDQLVLYSLKPGEDAEEDEGMSERLRALVHTLLSSESI